MRVVIKDMEGKALFDYLKDNQKQLIARKKLRDITSEPFNMSPEYTATKSIIEKSKEQSDNPNELGVSVIANMSMFCDSFMDVQGNNCWDKSIKENGPKGTNLIYQLHDHKGDTDGIIAEVNKIFMKEITLSDLGISSDIDRAKALVFQNTLVKELNPSAFTRYRRGLIKQHSVGMRYVKLLLALNDPDSEKEFKIWIKYIDKIINRELPEKKGFFWYVEESKLLENSAVLWGANPVTPTLEIGKDEPLEDSTLLEPPEDGTPVNDKKKTELQEVTEFFKHLN